MAKRNLLVCFDAFGTLFKPKRPIEQQYGEVARSLGLSGFTDDELKTSFRAAFKNEAKQNPNFGKANGLDAKIWWTNIIYNTFQPLVAANQPILSELAPKLLHRFWSDEGYSLLSDVHLLLGRLRNQRQTIYGHVVIGVITNSDDRVPDVLSSLGVRVNPLRYGDESLRKPSPEQTQDIDFSVMSYDVGHEKPDKRIFAAAEMMLHATVNAEGEASTPDDQASWLKVYIGDEYDKDIVGAVGADWNAILIGAESANHYSDVKWLDDVPAGNFQSMFESSKAVGFSSLGKLAQWLPESQASQL